MIKIPPTPASETTHIVCFIFGNSKYIIHYPQCIFVNCAAYACVHGIAQFFQCSTHISYAVNPQGHPEDSSLHLTTHLEFNHLSPFKSQIMGSIKALLFKQPCSYTNIMIWAACCLAFFGSVSQQIHRPC